MKDTYKIKADGVEYEIFIAPEEEYYEVYEDLNPNEGLIFNSKKQLITFVNFLTDIIGEKVVVDDAK